MAHKKCRDTGESHQIPSISHVNIRYSGMSNLSECAAYPQKCCGLGCVYAHFGDNPKLVIHRSLSACILSRNSLVAAGWSLTRPAMPKIHFGHRRIHRHSADHVGQSPLSGRTGCGYAGGIDGRFGSVAVRCPARPDVAALEPAGRTPGISADRRELRVDDRQPLLAGPLAVALAIAAMHYLHCIHPPGGATALTAVAGGASVHELGYHFVLTPCC